MISSSFAPEQRNQMWERANTEKEQTQIWESRWTSSLHLCISWKKNFSKERELHCWLRQWLWRWVCFGFGLRDTEKGDLKKSFVWFWPESFLIQRDLKKICCRAGFLQKCRPCLDRPIFVLSLDFLINQWVLCLAWKFRNPNFLTLETKSNLGIWNRIISKTKKFETENKNKN